MAQNRMGRISPVLFLLVGAIWLAVTVVSSQSVLVWPGVTSILSGVSLLVASAKQLRRPLGIASSLSGLAVSLFQLYLAASLLGSALAGLVVYSLATFVPLVVLQLILLYSAAKL